MPVQDVERTITEVSVHLREYQASHPRGPVNSGAPANNLEMSTRYIIIDPVLRSLGWDLSDPSQCVVEYATEDHQGNVPRVDYALLGPDGSPIILVEAKRLELSGRGAPNAGYGDDFQARWDDARDALCEYLNDVNVDDADNVTVGVLTNGQEWEIFRAVEDEWVRDDKPIFLGSRWIKANARRLHSELARDLYW